MFENCLNSPIFWKRLAEKQEEGEQGRRHEFEKGGGGTESLKNCLPPWLGYDENFEIYKL